MFQRLRFHGFNDDFQLKGCSLYLRKLGPVTAPVALEEPTSEGSGTAS